MWLGVTSTGKKQLIFSSSPPAQVILDHADLSGATLTDFALKHASLIGAITICSMWATHSVLDSSLAPCSLSWLTPGSRQDPILAQVKT